jgi:hypothetical protein
MDRFEVLMCAAIQWPSSRWLPSLNLGLAAVGQDACRGYRVALTLFASSPRSPVIVSRRLWLAEAAVKLDW